MATVVIPKELNKRKDLITVPRGTYEKFLAWQKKTISAKIFKPTVAEKKALARGRKNFAKKNYVPLDSFEI